MFLLNVPLISDEIVFIEIVVLVVTRQTLCEV